jgi:hypothetical protein
MLMLLWIGWNSATMAQTKSSGDTTVLHKVKYANGKLSAYSWMLKSTGNGRATCWDPQGKVMFDSEISRNHGHHSVQFEHHANKVVSKVEESSAPDAGIQWYQSTYYFDEKGIKTGENHQSHDDQLHVRIQEPYVVPQKETQQCAILYNNETWFINQTEFTLVVSYTARNETKTDTLASGDTLKIGDMIQAQFFEDPSKTATFRATPLKKNKRSAKWEFTFQKVGEVKKNPSCMSYYFVIGQRLIPRKKEK